MLSSSSSKNSQRTGLSGPGEKISRIPPRRANCPAPSTCWARTYPAAMSRAVSAVTSYCCPTSSVKAVCRSTSGGRHSWAMAAAVATMTRGFSCASRYSAHSRRYSHWRLYAAAGRSCSSRAGSITGSRPVRARRSAVCRAHSCSSAHSISSGRPVCSAAAAATEARCTGESPVIMLCFSRPSMPAVSSRSWGIVNSCRISPSMCSPLLSASGAPDAGDLHFTYSMRLC